METYIPRVPVPYLLIPAREPLMSTRSPIHGIPTGWQAGVLSLVGGPVKRRLAQWGGVLEQINASSPNCKTKPTAI
jgi:hypothetical protein